MKVISIRMSEAMWEAVQDEANISGVSASEYMRNATLSAMSFNAGRRGNPEVEKALDRFLPPPKPVRPPRPPR